MLARILSNKAEICASYIVPCYFMHWNYVKWEETNKPRGWIHSSCQLKWVYTLLKLPTTIASYYYYMSLRWSWWEVWNTMVNWKSFIRCCVGLLRYSREHQSDTLKLHDRKDFQFKSYTIPLIVYFIHCISKGLEKLQKLLAKASKINFGS